MRQGRGDPLGVAPAYRDVAGRTQVATRGSHSGEVELVTVDDGLVRALQTSCSGGRRTMLGADVATTVVEVVAAAIGAAACICVDAVAQPANKRLPMMISRVMIPPSG